MSDKDAVVLSGKLWNLILMVILVTTLGMIGFATLLSRETGKTQRARDQRDAVIKACQERGK